MIRPAIDDGYKESGVGGVALTILGAYCTECLRPVNLPKPFCPFCCFGDREDCYAAYWEGERITRPAILVVKKAGRPVTERELSASAHREIIQHPLPDIDVRDQKSGADRVDKTTIINGTPIKQEDLEPWELEDFWAIKLNTIKGEGLSLEQWWDPPGTTDDLFHFEL